MKRLSAPMVLAMRCYDLEMRRTVLVVNFNGHPPLQPPQAVSFRAMAMGSARFVRECVELALDGVRWRDERHGELDAQAYRLTLQLSDGEPVERLSVELEGAAMPALARLCQINGWAAFDLSEGRYLDFEERAKTDRHDLS